MHIAKKKGGGTYLPRKASPIRGHAYSPINLRNAINAPSVSEIIIGLYVVTRKPTCP
jgi:hypothetical protein